MANKKFNEEEMNQLRVSPYVLDVTPNSVHFSAEFKERFWNAVQERKTSREILMEFGIDPDILGMNRVNGLKNMIRNEARKGKGFRDIKTYLETGNGFLNPEAKIRHLEQQLAYKDQEIEFLKKIASLGRGAVDS
jgi:hypothetical protein